MISISCFQSKMINLNYEYFRHNFLTHFDRSVYNVCKYIFYVFYLGLKNTIDTRWKEYVMAGKRFPPVPLSWPIIVETLFWKWCHFSSLLVLPLIENQRHLVLSLSFRSLWSGWHISLNQIGRLISLLFLKMNIPTSS